MKVIGIENMTSMELQSEMQKGGRFIIFQYVISVLVITFRRSSNVYFIKADESRLARGLPFTLISTLLGWWGLPWGIIYTIEAIVANFKGGRDVTQEILSAMSPSRSNPTTPRARV